ncbi:hypothetical protein FHG87_017813 [Trinorchestia longiramus]|nr:hypothetical protein FHG87_017813 [Trinorchestia longiramus]
MKSLLFVPFSVLLLHFCYTSEVTSVLPCLETAAKIWVQVEAPITGWYYKIADKTFQRDSAGGIRFLLTVSGTGRPQTIWLRKNNLRKIKLSYRRKSITLSCPDAQLHCRCRSLKLSGLPDYNEEYIIKDRIKSSVTTNVLQTEESSNSSRNFSSLRDAGINNAPSSDDEDCGTDHQCKNASQDTVYDILGEGSSLPSDEMCKRAEEYIFRHRNDIWWMRASESIPNGFSDSGFATLLQIQSAQEDHSNVFDKLFSISSQGMKLMKQPVQQKPSEPLKNFKQKRWAITESADRSKQKDFMNYFNTQSSKRFSNAGSRKKTGDSGRKRILAKAFEKPAEHSFGNTKTRKFDQELFNYHDSLTSRGFPNGVSLDYMDPNANGMYDGTFPPLYDDAFEGTDDYYDLSEPQAGLFEDLDFATACSSYFELLADVRLERDEALEAWILAVGNKLLAISDSLTLCPDAASGDWWWVETAPPIQGREQPPDTTMAMPFHVDPQIPGDYGDPTYLQDSAEQPMRQRKIDSRELALLGFRRPEKDFRAPLGKGNPSLKNYQDSVKFPRPQESDVLKFLKSGRSRKAIQNPPSNRNGTIDVLAENGMEESQILSILEYSDTFDYYDDTQEQPKGEEYEKLIKKNVMVSCFES